MKNKILIKENNAVLLIADEEVLVDLDMVDEIEKYTWAINEHGRVIAYTRPKRVYFHRLVVSVNEKENIYFKDRNKFNCQKLNLEIRPKKGPVNIFRTEGEITFMTAYYHKIQQYEVIFDTKNLELLSQYRWHIEKHKKYICVRGVNKSIKKYSGNNFNLSRLLMGDIEHGNVVDHIDRNPLNNTEVNLRSISPGENTQNKSVNKRSCGLPRNIYKSKGGKYQVRLSFGSYNTEEEALKVAKEFRSLHCPWSKEACGNICECLKNVLPNGIGAEEYDR